MVSGFYTCNFDEKIMKQRKSIMRDIPSDETFVRKCLDCGKLFKTDSRFVRVCNACKGSENYNDEMLGYKFLFDEVGNG